MSDIPIRSLMQFPEREWLVRCIPHGARVLEIGTWSGGTADWVLSSRRDVDWVAVDTLRGGVGNYEYTDDVQRQLLVTLRNWQPRMSLFVGSSMRLLSLDVCHAFDLVIVDGDHSQECVTNDLSAAAMMVRSRGRIVVHDYNSDRADLAGVRAATDAFLHANAWRKAESFCLSVVLEAER